VNHLDPKDRDIAMVFQSYALYPNLSVYENIRFPSACAASPQSEHDARVRRAAQMVELGDFLDRRPPRSREGSGSASPWPAPSSVSPPSS
jgi:multiple sugar transport system ATP-binding protein